MGGSGQSISPSIETGRPDVMSGLETAVPIWQKFALTIKESAQYFGIGEKRLRNLVNDNPTADFILWVNSKCLIKRIKFEQFISSLNAL